MDGRAGGLNMEKFWKWLAWLLPRDLVGWCFVRVTAFATQGKFGNTLVPELRAMDALDWWLKQ